MKKIFYYEYAIFYSSEYLFAGQNKKQKQL